MRNTIICLFAMLFVACSNNELEERMREIRTMGNSNPRLALQMLDSIETDIRNSPEYLQKEYDLLSIRLNDKSDILATSDIKIKELIAYYEKKGNKREKQEVYYYAGSVYRDLHDTPRAMRYYLQAIEVVTESKLCDSIMLRNTYSNLHYIYYMVQDYKNALEIAKKEAQIATELSILDARTLVHLCAAYDHVDSTIQAKRICRLAIEHTLHNPKEQEEEIIYTLLYRASHLKDREYADILFSLTKKFLKPTRPTHLLYLSEYYLMKNETDSALLLYDKVLEDTFLYERYDAAKRITQTYHKLGDAEKVAKYAMIFINACNDIDFGKRQELAATVNNMYQYNKSEREEQRMKEEKEQARHLLVVISLLSYIIILIIVSLYIYRRNKRLHEILSLTNTLTQLKEEKKGLEENIAKGNADLEHHKKALREKDEKVREMNLAIQQQEADIKEKECLLSEKIEQNKTVVRLLHQAELESTAEEVIEGLRQSATGKRHMAPNDWKQLYRAVDELHPTFREDILNRLGRISEQQIQVYYLMRIGLSNTEIQNLTDLSRVTVWRWGKRFSYIGHF
ncbi:MAG: hypothetical protein IJ197_10320 [Bacteroidaceae bacterium]|nr:hypothetical protein [Bacteroidaceae bacterium]